MHGKVGVVRVIKDGNLRLIRVTVHILLLQHNLAPSPLYVDQQQVLVGRETTFRNFNLLCVQVTSKNVVGRRKLLVATEAMPDDVDQALNHLIRSDLLVIYSVLKIHQRPQYFREMDIALMRVDIHTVDLLKDQLPDPLRRQKHSYIGVVKTQWGLELH